MDAGAAIEPIDRYGDRAAACETPVSNHGVEAEQQLFQSEKDSVSQAELVTNSFFEASTRSSRRRSGSSLSSSITSLRKTRKSWDIVSRNAYSTFMCFHHSNTDLSPQPKSRMKLQLIGRATRRAPPRGVAW